MAEPTIASLRNTWSVTRATTVGPAPSYAPAYAGLASYYYVLAVLNMKAPGDVVPLAKSAETDPLSMLLHFAMAYSMYLAKHYQEAIACGRCPINGVLLARPQVGHARAAVPAGPARAWIAA